MGVGTHGTGLSHGNLASMITSLELISGNGEVLNPSLVLILILNPKH